jgi:hypothetical protein
MRRSCRNAIATQTGLAATCGSWGALKKGRVQNFEKILTNGD